MMPSEVAVNPMALIDAQDVPPQEAAERAERSEKGKPAPADLSAHEILMIAQKEFREQSALRGPIEPKEWPGVSFYYRRLNETDKRRIGEIHAQKGTWASILVERALDSKGEKIFTQSHAADLEAAVTPETVESVVVQMAAGSRTQLADEELGKS
jgi:hypothetical protein